RSRSAEASSSCPLPSWWVVGPERGKDSREGSLRQTPASPSASAIELPPVLLQMSPRFLLVGSVKPLHLTQTRPRRLEMREIHGARPVVVGEVARLPTVGRGLDGRERRIGQAGDGGPGPLLPLPGSAFAVEEAAPQAEEQKPELMV